MGSERLEQKLAAILYADVAGYSRLTGEDEQGTHRTLSSHLDLFSKTIESHHGNVVHFAGDAILADFRTVTDALSCAVEVQRTLAYRNEGLPDDRKLQFRVGINLGDVIVDRDDIYGDGVNVAARLEDLAEPGGICISETVRSAIGTKLGLSYEFLGEQQVKNIAEPVAAYKVNLDSGPVAESAEKEVSSRTRRSWWPAVSIAALLLIAVVVAGVLWRPSPEPPEPPEQPAGTSASTEASTPTSTATAASPDSEELSIAVLPFDNVSGETEQEYFADGITDDLITDLSKVEGLFVSTRNSVFAYKEQALQINQLAQELGVRYVLQGSVRKSGEKVRINTQLIDATNDKNIWAERYDGSLSDVFALQDEVTRKIVVALAANLSPSGWASRGVGSSTDPRAYDAYLRGWALYRRSTPLAFTEAIPHLNEAVSRDPSYGRAYAALAALFRASWSWGWHQSLGISHEEALRQAKQNLNEAMKHPTALAYQVSANISSGEGRHDEAIADAERAIGIDADDAGGYFAMANALIHAGRASEGRSFVYKAMELDPQYPSEYVFWLGMALFVVERYDEAVVSLERASKLAPNDIGTTVALVATYGHLGREQEAKATIAKLEGLTRRAGYENGVSDIALWPFKEVNDRERVREGLRKAGLTQLPFTKKAEAG